MKKLFFAVAILFGCLSVKVADAQVRVNLGVNISDQPEWGPVGYDHVEFYYFPQIKAFWRVPQHKWIYWIPGVGWQYKWNLPYYLQKGFDAYTAYKVVINDPHPLEDFKNIRERYAGYANRQGQPVIRDSRDERYRNHWRDNGQHRDDGDRH